MYTVSPGVVPVGASSDVLGHEAYMRYGIVAGAVLARVGGRILWHMNSKRTMIGDETDQYDEVIALICCEAGAEPVLMGV